jgi:hypothetical protein
MLIVDMFFRLNYYPVKSISEVVEVFTRETNNPAVDSVEGIMFSPDEGVIMAGYFVDKVSRGYFPEFKLHFFKPFKLRQMEV